MSKVRFNVLISIIVLLTPLFLSYTVFAYPDGAIIIHEDGTITGTDKILQNGNVYTLTGDISITGEHKHAGIQILKNGITIDGSQYSITTDGSGWIGVDLSEKDHVTIKNLQIVNFKHGVSLEGSSSNSITNNKIIGFSGDGPSGVPTGVWVSNSQSNTIAHNTIMRNQAYGILIQASSSLNSIVENILEENSIGIELSYCGNNKLRANQMNNNEQSLKLCYNNYAQFLQDIDASNMIDGKPLIYWINEHDKTVPTNAGFVALGNCTNITVKNLEISNTFDSITLINTNNSTIEHNNIEDCGNGIFLKYCRNISVTGNIINGNIESGIGTIGSQNITIAKNTITNSVYGISTAGQTQMHCGGSGSTKMTLTQNKVINCTPGIYFSLSRNNTISNNYFEGNTKGINLIASSENVFVENTFVRNIDCAFRISDSSNNSIFHNNFIENEPSGSQIVTGTSAGNRWDNGCEGNYWSNYQNKYSTASMIVEKGIWNIPYELNANNIDQYPLITLLTDQTLTVEPSNSADTHIEDNRFSLQTEIVIASITAIIISAIVLMIWQRRNHKLN
ncbi:MAG: right-handed parallel beta-helix repeat-containing protein [Candidatus Bathyarchaeia archaeon]